MTFNIITGDIRKAINNIDGFDCIVTSPPYWKLRDYGHESQVGQEDTVEAYVAELVTIFGLLRDKLSDDGTLFVNLGDRYKSGKLQCLPWRFAIAMVDAGWVLKNDVIWNRNRIMPESVKNRFTKSHEYLFFFATKSKGYTFNADAVRETALWAHDRRAGKGRHTYGEARKHCHTAAVSIAADGKRNRRSVWTIETSQTDGKHSATFPVELPKVCILAGSNPGDTVIDPFSGMASVGVAAINCRRKYIGVDVNSEYSIEARKRLKKSIELI